MGNNKVLKVALGKSEHDEHKPNLHLLSSQITGKVGLFFTTLRREDVVQLFSTFEVGCVE
jgi:mRNA turnover protein 4